MKKLFIIIFSIIAFIGCNDPSINENGCKVYEPNMQYSRDGKISYIVFDDHEYVLFENGYKGSICHSPKCKCLSKIEREF